MPLPNLKLNITAKLYKNLKVKKRTWCLTKKAKLVLKVSAPPPCLATMLEDFFFSASLISRVFKNSSIVLEYWLSNSQNRIRTRPFVKLDPYPSFS